MVRKRGQNDYVCIRTISEMRMWNCIIVLPQWRRERERRWARDNDTYEIDRLHEPATAKQTMDRTSRVTRKICVTFLRS